MKRYSRHAWLLLLATIVWMAGGAPFAAEEGPKVRSKRDLDAFTKDRANVYILPIRQEIFRDMAFKFHRMSVRAKEKADAIVLDINTPGGDLGSMVRMRDQILDFPCPVFAYVNNQAFSAGSLLALASDHIVMGEPANIGGAYPITATGQEVGGGSANVEEKFLSFTRAEWRSTALARGHDPDLAQRMTDPKHPLKNHPGLLEDGQLLTLDQEQATSVGLALFIASDIKDLLAKAGYNAPQLHEIEFTWSERLAGFLVNPVVSGILMLVALSAFFLEFKTPGVGVPLAIGLVAIGLFFWGSYLADLASHIEVLIFILGLSLLVVEVFIIPGFGVAGILGMLCIFGSLLFSMTKLPGGQTLDPVNIEAFRVPIYTLAASMAFSIPVFWLIGKFAPSTRMYRTLVLDPDMTATARVEDDIRSAKPRWTGKSGVAITDLHPVGLARFDGERVNVVTKGEFIAKGAAVRAVGHDGSLVIVTVEEEMQEQT